MFIAMLARGGDVDWLHLASPSSRVGLGEDSQVILERQEGAELAVSPGVLSRVPGERGPGDV